ncbi:RNaseH domain-containing protein [Kitasatospora sp. NPDC005856]|uniref:RNaseH domain-containing protein n=1 Tax=Kitasatospora sp. NPDC005856 TaxID=3154566 RepID=UPI0033D2A432
MARRRDLTAPTTTILCTPALLDGMTAEVWEFDEITQHAWKALEQQARDERRSAPKGADRNRFLLPYSIVANVLQQLTDGYVHLDRYLRFMVALAPVEPKSLRKVFTYLEGVVCGIPVDEIPLRVDSPLADLVAGTDSVTRRLVDVILPGGDAAVADPPSWAYQAIRWHVAKRMADVPFHDQEIEPVLEKSKKADKNGDFPMRISGWKHTPNTAEVWYRPDSSGDLIAWDHPIGPAFSALPHPLTPEALDSGYPEAPEPWQAQYALSRISVNMSTHPGRPEPVINLDAHMRRVNDTVVWSSKVMVDRGDGPILLVDLDGRKLKHTNRLALEILAKLDADATALNTVHERVRSETDALNAPKTDGQKAAKRVTEKPGTIRPLVPKQRSFQVGSGAGLHHLAMLHDHIGRAFAGKAEFLTLGAVDTVFGARIHSITPAEKKERKKTGEFLNLCGLPTPDSVRSSVEDQGFARLRIVCLWYRDETRLRMISALAHSHGQDVDMDPKDGDTVALADGIEAVFVRANKLLAHGPDDSRLDDVRGIVDRFGEDGVVLAAWCETEIPEPGEEQQGMKSAEARKDLAAKDAKFQLRRAFATELVPSQYIVGATTETGRNGTRTRKVITVPKDRDNDHRAFMALLDLNRSCGVVDDRYERALYAPGDPHEIPRMAFLGIHVRRQSKSDTFGAEPKRVVTASCLIPSAEPGGRWRILGWSNLHPYWESYRVAQGEFHKRNYIDHASSGATDVQRWSEAGRDINECLKELADELDGMPYAVILDGHGARRIFPGLHNNKQGMEEFDSFGRVWLPGAGLPEHMRPAGIVRINCFADEMPSIAYLTTRLASGDEKQSKTSSDLFRPQDNGPGHPWWVVTEPRNYGKTRFGQWKTRWRALPEKVGLQPESELKAPWYTLTCREVTPMFVGEAVPREGLAVAVARLCDQALSWSDRTRYPAPLHGALQMDLDHPHFRRSAPREFQTEDREILSEAVEGLTFEDD